MITYLIVPFPFLELLVLTVNMEYYLGFFTRAVAVASEMYSGTKKNLDSLFMSPCAFTVFPADRIVHIY
jgi:exopolysaccharide biosynthesis protein